MIEALVGLGLLSFGLLSMIQFQTRLIAQATEAQSRALAAALADELLSFAMIDPANANCYTLPAAGTCASTAATSITTDWLTRAAAMLPGTVVATSTVVSGTQLRVVLNWTGKASNDTRTLEAVTDVRP